MEQAPALTMQIVQGIGLAACAGMRAFLPLFVAGAAGRLEWVKLADSFDWLQSTPALVVFGVAVVVELLSDKIPLVDNLLDMLQFAIKPIAGTLAVAALLTELDPLPATVIGIVTGATTADLVHLAKTKLRLFSTSATAGVGNPVLSAAEDGTSFLGSLLAIFVPILQILVVIVGLVLAWMAVRSLRLRAARLGDGET